MGSCSRGGGGAGGCFSTTLNITNIIPSPWIHEHADVEDTIQTEDESSCWIVCNHHLQYSGSKRNHRGDPGTALSAEIWLRGEPRWNRGPAQRGGDQEAARQGCPGLPGSPGIRAQRDSQSGTLTRPPPRHSMCGRKPLVSPLNNVLLEASTLRLGLRSTNTGTETRLTDQEAHWRTHIFPNMAGTFTWTTRSTGPSALIGAQTCCKQ